MKLDENGNLFVRGKVKENIDFNLLNLKTS